ncbi:hypothetical protein [Tardiphaga sp.]|jgi:hypothetical protein|uniref:ribonuclease toxin HepT-like protein n=1 Tax=Tardiphaga sp. TaxID=1926292 RepID=UPI0037D9E74F
MHPNLLSARLQLADVGSAFERLLEIETEVIDLLPESKAGNEAKTILRAAQIEDIYTGIERTLKEVLKVTDVHIYADGGAWHKKLLLQAANRNDLVDREPIISRQVFAALDQLRAFRNVVRSHYGYGLRQDDVLRNEAILRDVVPLFLAEMTAFTDNYDPVPGNPRP